MSDFNKIYPWDTIVTVRQYNPITGTLDNINLKIKDLLINPDNIERDDVIQVMASTIFALISVIECSQI